MTTDRRTFLQLLASGALAASLPPSIGRALSIPAHHRTGTIADVEHIVILMQENRSFDHYFGSLRGVRGFGDPRAVRLPSGKSVWQQPKPDGGYVLPFHPDAPDLGAQFLVDLPHGWNDTIPVWNGGNYDQWIKWKTEITMAYLTRKDLPYHYALADAFTICDAYHCSFMGATDPNRYHMFTGWLGNDGQGGGPVLDNSEAGYDWSTYPERLQQAGISWKIYQDVGEGLDQDHYWGWGPPYIGNYGDNSLLYFHQYQNAQPGSPLFEGARRGTNITESGTLFDMFAKDARDGKLPQVSWVIAPEAYSEHGNWPSNYGAWYVSQILDALTENPEVWSKTAFFVNFDENDGFFDHIVPPTPPMSREQGLSTVETTYEIFPGSDSKLPGPLGLGVRVPMLVISPWSKGGWVSSEVFDHTSLIRFIEQRYAPQHPGLIEKNITEWRRAVVGDLTSAFNFKNPNDGIVELPSTASYVPADYDLHPDYVPDVPADQTMPSQEPGVRPARAVPYDLRARCEVDVLDGALEVEFGNKGRGAAVFQVRSGNGEGGPWTYTVGAGKALSDSFDFTPTGDAAYDLSVYGPNGFLRRFKGGVGKGKANLNVDETCHAERLAITLEIDNRGSSPVSVRIFDAYTNETLVQSIRGHKSLTWQWPLRRSFGWYDLTLRVAGDATFERRLAGHVESGRDSVSDPALGRQG